MNRQHREKLGGIFCAIFRHSNIEESCWGYHYCTRCGAQLGDSLAGAYSNSQVVGIHCDCSACRENYATMGFMDTFLAKTPEWRNEPEGWGERRRAEARADMDILKREMDIQQGDSMRFKGN